MRRIATTAGTLTAAALLALAAPSPASAANGLLIINGYPHIHPSGCYPTGDDSPTTVANRTHDAIAYVFTGPDCTGDVDTVVQPGRLVESDSGASVWVD
ncbi:hypothetical protein AB0D04_21680 [Streptomyces sp. NPDC048483]|uniref:hypothetical protein n=1 Tax=Streptomyces sp. NPDC048483 TaxID=3154927 RepID=UPI0034316191